jgi:alkanesulfonate monooxygenase SsuD/methylene tetrahydromethanopterin reductase-like flavin-dependent oxidoreductase (luciferase family)
MRLGAVFPQAQFRTVDPDAVVRLVQRLEDAGYDHLLVYDHVLGADISNRPDWTGYYNSADPFLEALVLFAYVARSCSLELVTDVLVSPQRQTALVAKQVATLSLLAPGRVRLGVGIGWNDVEYQALGIDFLHARGPNGRADTSASSTLDRAERRPHRYDGNDRCRGSRAATTRPGADLDRVGTDSRAVARVGRLADGWLPEPTVQPGRGFEPAWLEVRAAATAAGRDPDALGLEGQLWSPPDQESRLPHRLARWRDAGADGVGINTGRAGVPWTDEQLDALLRAADATS